MANKEINEITVGATPLDGTEQLHMRQGVNSRRVTTAEIADFVGRGPQAQAIGRAKWSDIVESEWTAQNDATPDTNAYQNDGTWLIKHVGDDQQSWVYHSVDGSADFDVVMVCSAYVGEDSFAGVGCFVADGDTVVGMLNPNYNEEGLLQYWTKPGTFGSNSSTLSFTPKTNNYFQGTHDLIYYRITLVGTTVTFYQSPNGIDWYQVFTANDTDNGMVEIDQVGIFIDSNNVATNDTYIRLLGYDDTGPQDQLRTGGGTLPVAFKGFRADKSADATESSFPVTFGTLNFDTESGWDAVNSYYVVPASIDGKYGIFMGGRVITSNIANGAFLEEDPTGDDTWPNNLAQQAAEQAAVSWVSAPILLQEGARYRVNGYGGSTIANDGRTFFGMAVIESSEDAFDVIQDTTTTRTLTDADFKGNRTIFANNAGAIAYTLDTGLTPAGPLTIYQEGAGAVTVSGTATLSGKGTATNGQGSFMTIVPHPVTADEYAIGGDIV